MFNIIIYNLLLYNKNYINNYYILNNNIYYNNYYYILNNYYINNNNLWTGKNKNQKNSGFPGNFEFKILRLIFNIHHEAWQESQFLDIGKLEMTYLVQL